MSVTFAESVGEKAALALLENAGWQVRNGAGVAPGELRVKDAERAIQVTTV